MSTEAAPGQGRRGWPCSAGKWATETPLRALQSEAPCRPTAQKPSQWGQRLPPRGSEPHRTQSQAPAQMNPALLNASVSPGLRFCGCFFFVLGSNSGPCACLAGRALLSYIPRPHLFSILHIDKLS